MDLEARVGDGVTDKDKDPKQSLGSDVHGKCRAQDLKEVRGCRNGTEIGAWVPHWELKHKRAANRETCKGGLAVLPIIWHTPKFCQWQHYIKLLEACFFFNYCYLIIWGKLRLSGNNMIPAIGNLNQKKPQPPPPKKQTPKTKHHYQLQHCRWLQMCDLNTLTGLCH